MFPENIKWRFNDKDALYLRHAPDWHVRPGGAPYIGEKGNSDEKSPVGLVLAVSSLLPEVPLGAPVRVVVRLSAVVDQVGCVPSDISLASEFVSGSVVDPSGVERTFSPLVLCLDGGGFRNMKRDQYLEASYTLLRGGQGALFPSPGTHTIRVKISWHYHGELWSISSCASVIVTPALDPVHERIASKLLSTPDTLLTMVLGGDHLKNGVAAILDALQSPVLRPHYTWIEAKRLCGWSGARKPDLAAAAALIDFATVLSPAERDKARALFKQGLRRIQKWRENRAFEASEAQLRRVSWFHVGLERVLRLMG